MTDIPPVNEKYTGAIGEVVLGKGDYIVGGAKGMPFLSFEHRTNRRPIVAGEVYDTLVDYPELAANMFDGRQKDPVEWAHMWKTLGVDRIPVRLASLDPAKGGTTPEAAAELVKKISDKTEELFDSAANSVKIKNLEMKIDEQYENLGRIVYRDLHTEEDLEDISSFIGLLEGVDNAVTVRQLNPQECKISLRTDGKTLNASAVCAHFGGGGHAVKACQTQSTTNSKERSNNHTGHTKLGHAILINHNGRSNTKGCKGA